jgi:imidazolonepropionase-like amidohydrolase
VPVTVAARRIITRADREPLDHGAVRVSADGVIDAVGRAADFPFVDSDLGDITLIPGMIDAHVHLSSDCSPAMGWLPGEEHPEASAVLRIVANAHAFLRAGVTTVRDLGTEKGLAGLVRDSAVRDGAVRDGAVRDGGAPVPMARILTANQPITITGGHCAYMGITCDSVDDLRRAVRLHAAQGSDWIKVMASGGFTNPRRAEGDAIYRPLFTDQEMAFLVEQAHQHGIRVAAHAQNRASIEQVFRAGVDTIEHATFSARPRATVDEALVAEIAAAGRYVIPTVNNYWLTAGVPWAPADLALANLRRLYDLGVPLVAGTDMGLNTTTPGLYAEGLMVFAEIGMDPRDILASATHRAADAIGLADQAGEIAVGRPADLAGLDGDPLTDPGAYRRVRFVMRGGQRCL